MNFSSKFAKGMGIVPQIMSILSEVSLGVHYFEIAMLLREAMFVNGILTNVEALYGIKKENIEMKRQAVTQVAKQIGRVLPNYIILFQMGNPEGTRWLH